MPSQPYLTPERFALGGYGIDTSSLTRAQLRQKLMQATSDVNAFCNFSVTPDHQTDFRGGTVTAEQHTWPIPEQELAGPGSRRVYLNRWPVRAITGFRIRFTTNYQITLPPEDLFINTNERYIEVIASQPTIIGYPPLGYWFGLYEPVCETDYSYGFQFTVTDDILEADSATRYYASHGSWLAGGTVTVAIDGVTVSAANYTVSTDSGSVTFTSAAKPTPGQEVTASYTYTLPQQIADACGIIATDRIAKSRIAARGMIGLSSMRVAEVSLTQMAPNQYTMRNGISIPNEAASLLGGFAAGRAA